MLHALGITHVVSVGECALIPPINWDDARFAPPTNEEVELALHRLGPVCSAKIKGNVTIMNLKDAARALAYFLNVRTETTQMSL